MAISQSTSGLAIVLSANATQFTNALRDASQSVAKFTRETSASAGDFSTISRSSDASGELARRLNVLSGEYSRASLSQRLFAAGSTRLTSVMGGLRGAVSGVQSRLASMGLSIRTLGLAGIVAGVANASRQLDELAKTSARLGIPIQYLESLRIAAGHAGIETQSLTDMMRRLLVETERAANGTGEAREAFATLGLEAATIARLPADRKLEAIADALQGVESRGARANAVVRLFGEKGLELLPVLENGAAGLRAMTDEGSRFGAGLTALEASKIEAMNDAFGNLWTGINSAFTQLTLFIAEGLEMTGMIDTINVIAEGIAGLGSIWQRLQIVMGSESAARALVEAEQADAAEASAKSQVALQAQLSNEQAKAAAAQEKAVDSIIGKLRQERDEYGLTADEIEFLTAKRSGATDAELQEIAALQRSAAARRDSEAAIKAEAEAYEANAKSLESVRGRVTALRDELANRGRSRFEILQDELRQGGGSLDEIREVARLAEEYRRNAESVKETAAYVDRLREGLSLFDETRSPLEKAGLEIENLNRLMAEGAIDAETYQRKLAAIQADAFGDRQLTGGAAAGSTELARIDRLIVTDNAKDQIPERQLEELEKIGRELREQRRLREREIESFTEFTF